LLLAKVVKEAEDKANEIGSLSYEVNMKEKQLSRVQEKELEASEKYQGTRDFERSLVSNIALPKGVSVVSQKDTKANFERLLSYLGWLRGREIGVVLVLVSECIEGFETRTRRSRTSTPGSRGIRRLHCGSADRSGKYAACARRSSK
jgi:hypothetical protein